MVSDRYKNFQYRTLLANSCHVSTTKYVRVFLALALSLELAYVLYLLGYSTAAVHCLQNNIVCFFQRPVCYFHHFRQVSYNIYS